MQSVFRPYVTAGVAIVGASLIAVTPVATPLPDVNAVRNVALTASDGFTDLFNTTSQNATLLLNNFLLAPGVAWQQFFTNQAGFAQQLLTDPANTNEVVQQMQAHLDAVLTGFTLQNSGAFTIGGDTVTNLVAQHTLSATDINSTPPVFGHDLLFALLPSLLPANEASVVTPIVDFLASPLSGILLGSISPLLTPWVALINAISGGDSFEQILASPLNGLLNGATINLDSLIPLVEQLLPPSPLGPLDLTHLDFALGGLLSPGVVAPIYQVAGAGGTIVDSVPAVGGSIFNSLGLSLSALGLNIDIASHGVGPLAAWEGWGQTVGALLGSGWDGKGPVTVTAPGPGITLPLLPTDTPAPSAADFDDGGAAADSLAQHLQDVLSALDLSF